MAYTPGGGGGSDLFSVSPSVLQDAAPTYANAAQDISILLQDLQQLASGDLFLLYEFAQLASRLEYLQARIHAALECAIIGLYRISTALQIVAEESRQTDQQTSLAFAGIENDPTPWNPPTIPGILLPPDSGYGQPLYPQPGGQPPVKPEGPPFIIPTLPLNPGYGQPLYPQPGGQPPVKPGEPPSIIPPILIDPIT